MADQPSDQPFRFRGFQVPNYTQVPDELFDELLTVLSGAELKVTLYIIRRTFGFKKVSDNISLSQMLNGIVTRDGKRLDHGVGLSKPTLLNALRSVVEMQIVISERRRSADKGDEATTYRLNLAGNGQSSPNPLEPGNGGSNNPDGTPVVKKFDHGESGNLTRPVVKKSAPQETVKQETVKVVNALPTNDQNPIPRKGERRPAARPPSISDRALRATHAFTDEQLAQVHYLVEKQTTLLGAADRNHAHYVKRAAESVTGGTAQLLDTILGEFKQAATTIAVKSPPSFFHAMWKEALQKRHTGLRTAELVEPIHSPQPHGFEPLSTTLASRKTIPGDSAEAKITRMLEDAARRGFPIPESIRQNSTYQTVAHWWATLPEHAEHRGRSGAP